MMCKMWEGVSVKKRILEVAISIGFAGLAYYGIMFHSDYANAGYSLLATRTVIVVAILLSALFGFGVARLIVEWEVKSEDK